MPSASELARADESPLADITLPESYAARRQELAAEYNRRIVVRCERCREMEAERDAAKIAAKMAADSVERLQAAIAEHHGQKADDLCWLDDQALYAQAGLPQRDNRVGDPEAMLENCRLFIRNRCEGGGPWRSYAELESDLEGHRKANALLNAGMESLAEDRDALKLRVRQLEAEGLDQVDWRTCPDCRQPWPHPGVTSGLYCPSCRISLETEDLRSQLAAALARAEAFQAEAAEQRRLCLGLAERVSAQSELLARRAEKPYA